MGISILAWLVAGAFYALIRFFGTHESLDQVTSREATVLLWFIGSTLFGVVYWYSQVLSESRALRQKSYGVLLLFKSAMLGLMSIVMVMITRIAAYLMGNIPAQDILPSFLDRLSSKAVLVFVLYVLVTAAIFAFISQMRLMIGSRVLWELMLGKYYVPKQETRIFMFLDLKSSTGIAETLGHIRYSQMIRDCFSDLTDAALQHRVEIYQYVGDEAVLTWRVGDGLKDANCIKTFFSYQKTIQNNKDYYLKEYGFLPEFKAGLNIGSVTVAEIGVIKREIAFHGEAVITASRIEGCCNEYGRSLLVSEELKKFVHPNTGIKFLPIGKLQLRGKQDEVAIFGVEAA